VHRVAERYMRAGLAAIPVPPKAKNPNRPGWQHERHTIEDIPNLWNNGQGIGLLWGEPSGGHVDVDLDWPEARSVASYLLPNTKTFGRGGSPHSHRVYRTEGRIPRTKRYKLSGDGDDRSVVELLSTGTQSLVPPSVHESGEVRSWDKGRIARVDGAALEQAVADVATAALLARKWPGKGTRHDYVLAATGYIARRLPHERVERIMEAAIAASGDEEAAERRGDVRDTLETIASGLPATGGPTLDQLAPGVPDQLRRWHGWGSERAEPRADAPHSNGDKKKLTANEIADAVTAGDHFAQDAGGKLYRFSGGTYNQYAERYIRRRVKELLEDSGRADEWSSHKANEVVEYIRADAPELWERPPLDEVNVLNGILNVETRELREHDPAFLSPVQIPVRYDPEAACPAWEKFVAEVFPEDARDLAFELAADLITPSRSAQKAILLLGEGSNGKSTYLRALTALVGSTNAAGTSLHKLESNRFATTRLIGKLANICPDLPSGHLTETSVFKALTGGDYLDAEYKYARDSFEFMPYCRLVFSANHVPRSGDASHAFFRRWLVVPFNRTFEPGEQTPREELDSKLSDPRELSGVLNRALEVLPRVRREGFSESESMREAHEEFRAMTDPVSVWLTQKTITGPDVFVPQDNLVNAYNSEASARGHVVMSKTAFTQALKRVRPEVEIKQRTYNGKSHVRCYIGIALKDSGPEGDGGHRASGDNDINDFNDFSPIVSDSVKGGDGGLEISEETNKEKVVKPVKPVNADEDLRGAVGGLLADPPDWLPGQMAALRKDPALLLPTCAAISHVLFGTYERREEVRPIIEEVLRK